MQNKDALFLEMEVVTCCPKDQEEGMKKPYDKKICGLKGYLLALLEAEGFTLLDRFYGNKETLLSI
jgi:hypothetical protein